MLDAIVVGAGPNGLAAAIVLARAGHSVRVYEAQQTIGGGTRSAELTQPGFVHDTCATVHAMGLLSPFLRSLPLADHGVEFVHPRFAFAHPFDDGSAIAVRRSLDETVDALPSEDGRAYRRLIAPFASHVDELMEALLAPIGRHPSLLTARFGVRAIRSAQSLASRRFRSDAVRAMVGGVAAHSMVPLDSLATAGYTLALLVAAHTVGWPVARGGSQRLADAMASYLRSLGGEIIVGESVESLAMLPPSRVVLCDVSPAQLLRMAGERLPPRYARRLARFRRGPGVFKMDWALRAPAPWRNADCRDAGTLHLGGTMRELARSERDAWEGRVSAQPYVLAVQATQFDSTRAPAGGHTLWGYCHVPNGSGVDMTEAVERQVERFAPGFRDCIISRSVMGPAEMEARNANLLGGDIAGGAADLMQVLARPVLGLDPYATPVPGLYLCSASTPPGIGVHGMCGYHAATSAAKYLRRTG